MPTTKLDDGLRETERRGYGRAVRVSVWMLEFPDASSPEKIVEGLEARKIAWAAEEDALEFLYQVRAERAEALSHLREAQ